MLNEFAVSDVQADDAPTADQDVAPASAKESRNLVTRKGFPHQRVTKLWEARAKFCEESDKENEKDYKEAENWYRGTSQEASGTSIDDRTSQDSKFSGNILYSDVNKLVSFLMHQDTKTSCKPGRGGDAMKTLAEATQKLADIAAREGRYREQKRKAFVEAIFRNHGYVRQGWNHYDWLPTLTWPDGEVRLDPDCSGDMRRARFMIEEYTTPLDSLLEDEEIPLEIRRELQQKPEIHKASRPPEWSPNTNEADRVEKEMQTWDTKPGFTKVTCLRIWSREGLLPGQSDRDEVLGGSINDGPESMGGTFLPTDDPRLGGRVPRTGTNPNASYRAPTEMRDDAAPEPPEFDPLEHGRRVYLLLVKDFHKVLKVTDWPLDHYRRDEFPYVEVRFTDLPGDLHGVPIFRAIRPHLKAINKVFETWINDKRHGARRIVEVAEGACDNEDELQKLEKGGQWEVVRVKERNGIGTVAFAAKDDSYKELIPALMRLHDDASGVNDVLRGQAGDVQKTATEATKLDDNAAAALGYLEDALERFEEDEARMRVAALQRYVPRESTYPGCPFCGVPGEDGKIARGPGMIANPEPFSGGLGIDLGAGPDEIPCPACSHGLTAIGGDGAALMAPPQPGNGWDPAAFAEGRPIVKGADFWLTADEAVAWRDDLSIDQIRAEVVVSIKPGSSRRDYREREVARLRNAGQDLIPFYQQLGGSVGARFHRAYIAEVVDAVGISDPRALVPTEADLEHAAAEAQAAAQAQQQAAMAQEQAKAPRPPAGPSPEQTAAEQAIALQEEQMKAQGFQHRREMDLRKADIEERRFALEETPHRRALELLEEQMTMMTDWARQAEAARAEENKQIVATVANLAEVVEAMRTSAAAIGHAAGQVVAATVALQATAAAPKRIVIERGADGKVAGAEVIPQPPPQAESK